MSRGANYQDPRREYQRVRILAAIQDEALTALELAARLHLSRDHINWHLKGMKSEKPRRLYVAGFAPNPEGGRPPPKYKAGSARDMEYVKTRAPKGRKTAADRESEILALLLAEPRTATELTEAMRLRRAKLHLTQLHDARKVYIAEWRSNPNGGYPSPVYAAGGLQDAERPAPLTGHERGARHWTKLKADPHRHGLHLQRNRMRKKPQTWLSALMR